MVLEPEGKEQRQADQQRQQRQQARGRARPTLLRRVPAAHAVLAAGEMPVL
jgi:hypothetical protein